MYAHSTADALRKALEDIPQVVLLADSKMLDPLHKKVCAVVDELRATGMAPEHVLLAVKGIAYEAKMGAVGEGLVETMVKWRVEQYFANPV